MKFLGRKIFAALSVPLAAAAVLGTAPQASAASGTSCGGDGHCLRLFYNSNRAGSSIYFWGSDVADLAGYKFLTSGAGQGTAVKNGAASADNGSPYPTTIFFNSNYGGSCDTLTDYAIASRLQNTYNNDASFRFNYTKSTCYKF